MFDESKLDWINNEGNVKADLHSLPMAGANKAKDSRCSYKKSEATTSGRGQGTPTVC